jgi:hypothetical protein
MREFGALHGVLALEQARAEHWQSWSARAAMANMGLEADQIERYVEDYLAFWHPRFFSSAYCTDDIPIEGAIQFVARVLQAKAKLVYLTGRHGGMRAGTVESLGSSGFPIPEGADCQLLMKSDKSESDDAFKERMIAKLMASTQVVAAFDNEPAHINLYRNLLPSAIAVHLFTDHSGRNVTLLPGIVSIAGFPAVNSV